MSFISLLADVTDGSIDGKLCENAASRIPPSSCRGAIGGGVDESEFKSRWMLLLIVADNLQQNRDIPTSQVWRTLDQRCNYRPTVFFVQQIQSCQAEASLLNKSIVASVPMSAPRTFDLWHCGSQQSLPEFCSLPPIYFV
ncbi:hypothetical protein SISNIDRAFT_489496 [Sistotremastrum niveocremeum HHB9708]|uniref:Uncharacterized protein n=1 Tax=Sistotremastrum niveocremeum HHB9708 TaxID=1314777 RepID=A0A164PUK7_9AGAM|nr:hypothetical protein SISNIDRAFT_489496 [Sistotremastrum niveocremeum HHB9708]